MFYSELKVKYEQLTNEFFILEDLIHDYRDFLFAHNCPLKLKRRTKEETLLELYRFDKFLLAAYPDMKKISDIDTKHIENYRLFCKEALKNTNITINKKIRAIRLFFDYLRNVKKIIKYNVALEVSYYSTEEAEHPLHVPKSKLRILIDLMYSEKYGVRDVCITKMLAYLGLRINEIFELSIDSVNLDDKELYIKRENGYMTYHIPDILYVDLKNYVASRNDIHASDNTLFLSNTGKPYPIREYQRKFKYAVIDADFKEPFTPRNVRATFAYYMAKNLKEEKLQLLLDQYKVEQYYIDDDIIDNPLIMD